MLDALPRVRARGDWCVGALALSLACGPQPPPEGDDATGAGGSTSTSGPGATTHDAGAVTSSGPGTVPQTSSGADTTGAASTGEAAPDLPPEPPWTPIACDSDALEPNGEAMQAAAVDVPCNVYSEHWDCLAEVTACHAVGDEDWYLLPAAPESTQWTRLHLELSILPHIDSCNCGDEPIPTGPELASTVEVFDAQSLVLLGSVSGTDPHVWLVDSGPQFGAPLLIRVVGPADVAWTYELWIYRQDSTWEDGCEC